MPLQCLRQRPSSVSERRKLAPPPKAQATKKKKRSGAALSAVGAERAAQSACGSSRSRSHPESTRAVRGLRKKNPEPGFWGVSGPPAACVHPVHPCPACVSLCLSVAQCLGVGSLSRSHLKGRVEALARPRPGEASQKDSEASPSPKAGPGSPAFSSRKGRPGLLEQTESEAEETQCPFPFASLSPPAAPAENGYAWSGVWRPPNGMVWLGRVKH